MAEPVFAEYAIKLSNTAQATRRALPPEARSIVDRIEADLADDPTSHPDRVIPASLDGTSYIYMHPDPPIQITFQVDEQRKVIYFFHYSAPTFRVQQTIFISYSHSDKPWLAKLKTFLTVLEQKGVIKFWDDGELKPGVPWEDQIREALDSAKAGLLLVSQEFLASKFITETELPRLLDDAETKGKRIFWLHLSPSTVFETHREITRFQALMNPETSLEELEETQLRKVLVGVSKALGEAVA